MLRHILEALILDQRVDILLVEVYTHSLMVEHLDALHRATLNKLLNHLPVTPHGRTARVTENSVGYNTYSNHSPKPHEVETWLWGGSII